MSDPFRHGPLSVTASGPPDGKPVVLLHGWGSSAALMEPVARGLADRWRIYNVDLPGHGTAPVPGEAMDLDDHAAAVAALVREVAPGGAALVGHSNGGRIAMRLATRPATAALAKRLVLVSPSGIRRKRTLRYAIRKSLASALKAPFSLLPGRLRELGLDWLRHSLVWRMLGSSDYRNVEGVMRQIFVSLVNTYVEDDLPRLAVPVLVFRGTRDEAVTADQVRRLVSLVPDAGLVQLPGAGHYGFLDAPEPFLAGTRHFLEAWA